MMVAALALVLFMLAALVVDLGLARDTRRAAQNTADSAVLAAANQLYASGVADKAAAIQAAKDYARSNFGTTDADWAGCSDPNRPTGFAVVTGETPCVSFKGSPLSEVRVVIPTRAVSTPFGSLAGISKVDVAALAQAKVSPGGKAQCGLCIIGTGAHDIQNGDVTVQGANVYINGSTASGPNGSLVASGGGIYLQGSKPSKGTQTPAPYTDQPAIADPLAWLTLPPDLSTLTAKTATACGTGATHGPGIYRSLNVANNSTCVLQPGLYVITGGNSIAGNTTINAFGVTLYFACQDSSTTTPKVKACTANQAGGGLTMTGNAALNITAPTTGSLAGLAVVADRNNAATQSWRGNGAVASSGTIYLAGGTLDYRGNGSGLALDSLVVVEDMSFSGNPSAFSTLYTQSSNVQLPAGAINLTQ